MIAWQQQNDLEDLEKNLKKWKFFKLNKKHIQANSVVGEHQKTIKMCFFMYIACVMCVLCSMQNYKITVLQWKLWKRSVS